MASGAIAQNHGDFTIGGTLGFGSERDQTIIGGLDTEMVSKTYTYTFLPSFEYFFKDRKAAQLAIGYVGSQQYLGLGGLDFEEELFETVNLFVVQPSMNWYVPITEKLYYCPSLYMCYCWGSTKTEEYSITNKVFTTPEKPHTIFSTGFHLARIEYKVNDRLSASCELGLGNIYFQRESIKEDYDSNDQIEYINKEFVIGLNGSTNLTDLILGVKYYF